MASQYITYLLVFLIGLTLVVFSDSLFNTLTDDFKNSVADPELQELTERIRDQVIEGIAIVQQNPEINLQIDLDLPITLANKFTYELRVVTDINGYYILNASTTLRNSKQILVSTNLGINEDQINVQGVIKSTYSDPSILIAYRDNILTVEFL